MLYKERLYNLKLKRVEMINNKKCEILSPCGSYDILIAAIKAGADACYLGGNKFGARAFATNFDEDALIRAIDYAHLHDVNIYLTINTLFKNNEIEALYNYILPLYKAGLDALIVQDLGVFCCVKKWFPDIHVHCSTQMNITSYNAAKMMYEKGADRVVTAREMSLQEIKYIKDRIPDLEIESFVHGAMCYSYSGQCLMSSLAGGRSGNRGRCAQPCRKCYDNSYILSMKDMCALENIPSIIEAGIDSLKIEGRMKNEYYVASAVDAYKNIRDDYYNGSFDKDKALAYKNKLANIFNRGGFCNGYYFMHNGKNMISVDRPNNQGVLIGKVKGVKQGKICISLYDELYRQDVCEIILNNGNTIEITSGIDGKTKQEVWLNCPKTKSIKINSNVYRTRCNYILEGVIDKINKTDQYKKKVDCYFTGKIGSKISICLVTNLNDKSISVTCYGIDVEKSDKFTNDVKQIESKLNQIGDTEFVFDNIVIDIDETAFLPVGAIKNLRREAIEKLEEKIVKEYKRDAGPSNGIDYMEDLCNADASIIRKRKNNSNDNYISNLKIKIFVSSIEQLKIVSDYNIFGVYLRPNLYKQIKNQDIINKLLEKNIKIYIELPNIFRNSSKSIKEILADNFVYGVAVKNIDGMAYIKSLKDYNKEIVYASSLYAYNNVAIDEIYTGNEIFEIPKELNQYEFDRLAVVSREFIIYEHQQVMLSSQCVKKTTDKCSKDYSLGRIIDDKGNAFYYQTLCDECCNIIYNGVPYCNIDIVDDSFVLDKQIEYLKINFTVETEDIVRKLMNLFVGNIGSISNNQVRDIVGNTTTGHYFRGVD